MKLSVVVTFYNSEKTLPLCLTAIANQSRKPDELILVDNSSTDSSLRIAHEFLRSDPGFKIVITTEKKKGFAAPRNKAISIAKGDIIVFTDSDCVPHRDWLYELEQIFLREKSTLLAGVAGMIRGYRPRNTVQKFLSLFTLHTPTREIKVWNYNLVFGGFATTNLAIRKGVFNEVGSFDENPVIPEDHDLCARIYKKGYMILYSPKPLVYHIHRETLLGMIRQSFAFGKRQGGMLRKHFDKAAVIEFPRKTIMNFRFPARIWFNFNSADKKLLFLLVAGLIYHLFFLLIPAYFLYLLVDVRKRLKDEVFRADIVEQMGIVGLLFLKSFAMTLGRIYSSLKLGVFCI